MCFLQATDVPLSIKCDALSLGTVDEALTIQQNEDYCERNGECRFEKAEGNRRAGVV
jgi:hypothetical protein